MALMADKEALQLLVSERLAQLETLQQNIEGLQNLLTERGNNVGAVEQQLCEEKITLDKLDRELRDSQRIIHQVRQSNEALWLEVQAFNRSRAYRIGRFLTAPNKVLRRLLTLRSDAV